MDRVVPSRRADRGEVTMSTSPEKPDGEEAEPVEDATATVKREMIRLMAELEENQRADRAARARDGLRRSRGTEA